MDKAVEILALILVLMAVALSTFVYFFMLPFELAFGFLGPIISKIIGFSISMYFLYIFFAYDKKLEIFALYVCLYLTLFLMSYVMIFLMGIVSKIKS